MVRKKNKEKRTKKRERDIKVRDGRRKRKHIWLKGSRKKERKRRTSLRGGRLEMKRD